MTPLNCPCPAMESRATGCPLLFGSKVGVAHDPGADRMRREIAGEILRFLEGEKYLRESSVARSRKIWEGEIG